MRKPKLWEWIACMAIVLVIAMVLLPATACGCKGDAERISCISNLKQQGLAAALYLADWQDRLPNRDHWVDQIRGYSKYGNPFNDRIKKEPVKGGYAFNAALSDRAYGEFKDPAKAPLTYDSVNFGPNASDPVASLPEPARHDGRNNMSYLDSHAKGLPASKP